MNLRCLMLCLSVAVLPLAATEIVPDTCAGFYVMPNEAVKLGFTLRGAGDLKDFSYVLSDYSGREIASGVAAAAGDRCQINLGKLAQGYYELTFAGQDKAFGVIALPDYASPRDGYWQLDAGLTWSKWDLDTKKMMVKILTQKGIAGFRERLPWPGIDTAKGFDANGGGVKKIRGEVYDFGGEGRVLELFQDSPGYLRFDAANPFAVDLAKSFLSWQKIAANYQHCWSALELWNEPFYSAKGIPADQYVPVAKTVAAAVGDMPVVAGCVTPSIAGAYLDNCADNGLLDAIDAMTLHFYGNPETMANLIVFYRDYLKRYGKDNMPLWVSESGTPGQLGRYNRPTPKSDTDMARKTVMRAVECRALGVERFYAFYLQYHIEGVISWGMTDRSASPQRALSAWLYAAQTIGQSPYLGTVKALAGPGRLNRVFDAGGAALIVLYGAPGETVTVPFAVTSVAGIDGRSLPVENGTVTLADGLVYLKADKKALKIDDFGVGAGLFACLSQPKIKRTVKTLVLQPVYLPSQFAQATNNGYFVADDVAAKLKIPVNVANLANVEREVTVSLDFDGAPPQTVKLPPLSSRELVWELNLAGQLKRNAPLKILIRAQAVDAADQAALVFFAEPVKKTYMVVRSNETMVPDGEKKEKIWAASTVIGDLTCLNDNPDGKPIKPEDFRAAANFVWSDTGLHFLIEVDDPVHEAPETAALSWQKDSVQIAFSQENSLHDRNNFEWGFFLDGKGSQKVLFRSSGTDKLSDGTQISIRRDEAAQKTCYEGVISWLDLGSMNAINERAGSRFRLSFIVNDANRGERRWLEWSPGIAKSKKPTEYPELVLYDADGACGKQTAAADDSLLQKYQTVTPGNFELLTYQGRTAIRMLDRKDSVLTWTLPEERRSDLPFTLSFYLAATEFHQHKSTGFVVKAGFDDAAKLEGYECWISSGGNMFASRTGFALADNDGTLVRLGLDGMKFPTDGKFYKMTLFYDPVSSNLKLFYEKDGENLLLAEGKGKKMLQKIDQIRVSLSGWGAGPLLLSGLQVR